MNSFFERLAPLQMATFRLVSCAQRAHYRHQWPEGPQVGRFDPQESWAQP